MKCFTYISGHETCSSYYQYHHHLGKIIQLYLKQLISRNLVFSPAATLQFQLKNVL